MNTDKSGDIKIVLVAAHGYVKFRTPVSSLLHNRPGFVGMSDKFLGIFLKIFSVISSHNHNRIIFPLEIVPGLSECMLT